MYPEKLPKEVNNRERESMKESLKETVIENTQSSNLRKRRESNDKMQEVREVQNPSESMFPYIFISAIDFNQSKQISN